MSSSMSIVQQINDDLKKARAVYVDAHAAAMKEMEKLSPLYHHLVNLDRAIVGGSPISMFLFGIVIGAAAVGLLRFL
jgi:hypothetical protein